MIPISDTTTLIDEKINSWSLLLGYTVLWAMLESSIAPLWPSHSASADLVMIGNAFPSTIVQQLMFRYVKNRAHNSHQYPRLGSRSCCKCHSKTFPRRHGQKCHLKSSKPVASRVCPPPTSRVKSRARGWLGQLQDRSHQAISLSALASNIISTSPFINGDCQIYPRCIEWLAE
jgi:hypothetical protein